MYCILEEVLTFWSEAENNMGARIKGPKRTTQVRQNTAMNSFKGISEKK